MDSTYTESAIITSDELKGSPFTEKEIQTLCDLNFLQQVSQEHYRFSYERLFDYGRKLLFWKKYEKSNFCLKMCYKVMSDDGFLLINLIYGELKKDNYEEAFSYFCKLYCSNPADPKSNLFLFLFYNIMDLPEDYQSIARSLTKSDCSLSPNADGSSLYNTMVQEVFRQHILKAKELYNKLPIKRKTESLCFKKLFNELYIRRERERQQFDEYFQKGEYENIYAILKKRYEKRILSVSDKVIFFLIRDYLKIKQTGIIYEPIVSETYEILEALIGHNHDLAEELYIRLKLSKGCSLEHDKGYLLFQILKDLKKEITQEKSQYQGEFLRNLSSLLVQDFDNALVQLHDYLQKMSQESWEPIILEFIKIDSLTGKPTFQKTLKILAMIERQRAPFTIKECTICFQNALKEHQFEIASCYFNILKQSHTVGYPYQFVEPLEKLFQKYVEKDKTREYIERRREQLCEDGIVLSKWLPKERIAYLQEVVDDIPDIVMFSIDPGKNLQRIVLRYNQKPESMDLKKMIQDAKRAYQEGNYNEAIAINRELLKFGTPPDIVYAILGISYMKVFNSRLAIDYLTVATELNKMIGRNYDYTPTITFLRENGKEEQNPMIKNAEEEFKDASNESNILQWEEIKTQICLGTSLQKVMEMFPLSENQKSIVLLLLAKEYYMREQYVEGDQLLDLVRQQSKKTQDVQILLIEVRKRRPFYKNCSEEKQLQLLPKVLF